MALKPCKECGAQISTDAKACPQCGKAGRTEIGCLPTILILFAVGYVISRFTGPGETRTPVASAPVAAPRLSQEATIQAACRQMLKQKLHDPSSVEYLDLHVDVPVNQPVEGLYSTRQRVRAKNALGATVLTTFECGIMKKGSEYTLWTLNEVH